MPRKIRITEPGIYHIINRGVERRNIFLEPTDYEYMFDLLSKIVKDYKIILHTFCLMTNHYHILLETKEHNLSKVVQFVNDKYAKYFNKKYTRSGHLWQGRYKSYALYDDAHFWIVAKYIERNPIKANMVQNIEDYRFQSYFQWKNKTDDLSILNDSKIYDMTLKEYSDYIGTELQKDAIDVVYDSPQLVKLNGKYKQLTKRLKTFFEADSDINRNMNVKKAYEYGYTKSDIAKFLGITPAAVNYILKI